LATVGEQVHFIAYSLPLLYESDLAKGLYR
jgi:hypothetical protein